MGQSFPKSARVLHRQEFLAIQARARRIHCAHFVLLLRARGDNAPARLGLVTTRKIANAVGRNRIRRLVREVFRHEREVFPLGHDVVVIARDGAADLAFSQVRDEILGALARRRVSAPAAGAT